MIRFNLTRQVSPPGGVGRLQNPTLVVAIDQLGRIAFGCLRAAEEVDLLGDDLAAVAVNTRRIGPLRVVDSALPHRQATALPRVEFAKRLKHRTMPDQQNSTLRSCRRKTRGNGSCFGPGQFHKK
jgi:hypothetical protein